MTIALVAIVLDEEQVIERWIEGARRARGVVHEVVVVDGGSVDRTVQILAASGIRVERVPFVGDFAAQRNIAIEHTRSDWIIELDADETMSAPLASVLPAIVADATRDQVDVIGIPRLNFIDDELVASPGARGLDYQYRLHARGCRWTRRVHEELTVGVRNRVELDIADGRFLLHSKNSARHHERNQLYRSLG
jgi:glycosyltransferase involved in cell wall biosynthesis